MYDQQSLRSACPYAQSGQSLCLSLEYSMSVKLLTEHHLEFLSLKGGCTGSFESTLDKIPPCWKSRVTAHFSSIPVSIHDNSRPIYGVTRLKIFQDIHIGVLIASFKIRVCCLQIEIVRKKNRDSQSLYTNKGITVFKIFIWGVISSDIRSEI